MSAELDAMLADHRALTHEEALTVARALDIMEKHAEGVRTYMRHPKAGQAADIVLRATVPVGLILSSLLDSRLVAPRGYVPGSE